MLFVTASSSGALKLKKCFPFSVGQGQRKTRTLAATAASHSEAFLIRRRRRQCLLSFCPRGCDVLIRGSILGLMMVELHFLLFSTNTCLAIIIFYVSQSMDELQV